MALLLRCLKAAWGYLRSDNSDISVHPIGRSLSLSFQTLRTIQNLGSSDICQANTMPNQSQFVSYMRTVEQTLNTGYSPNELGWQSYSETVPRILGDQYYPTVQTTVQLEPIASVGFGNAVYLTTHRVVPGGAGMYAQTPHQRHVIKYLKHCIDPTVPSVDPALAEYYFLEILQNHKISPLPIFLSDALNMHGLARYGKLYNPGCTIYDKGVAKDLTCTVRYLIVEYVGISVMDLMTKAVHREMYHSLTLVRKLQLVVEMVNILEIVHNEKIIHGGITWSSFVIGNDGKVSIVNFDKSRVFYQDELLDTPSRCMSQLGHIQHYNLDFWLSPAEMRDCLNSFRDDMYRVIKILAVLIHNGTHYIEYMQYLTGEYVWNVETGLAYAMLKRYIEIIDNVDIFDIDSRILDNSKFRYKLSQLYDGERDFSINKVVDPALVLDVKQHLQRFKSFVVQDYYSLDSDPNLGIDSIPSYDGIRNILLDMIALLNGT